MKKNYILSLLTVLISLSVFSQTFVSDTTAKQEVTNSNQLMITSFDNLPAGGYGIGKLVVYFIGDFGQYNEFFTVNDEDMNLMGSIAPYDNNGTIDSTYLEFDASLIDDWMSDGQVDFSFEFLFVSRSANFIQCRLIYDYCTTGTPQTSADFTLENNAFCTHDTPVNLIGTPTGGVFSGNGISNNVLNPNVLSPGTEHTITYTATDEIGCVTSISKTIKISSGPQVTDLTACPDEVVTLATSSFGNFVWFNDANLTSVLDSGVTVLSQPLTQTTNFYVAQVMNDYSFKIDSLSVFDSLVVDINATAGDDRGGIAITPNYVYCVGDNNTVRANANDLGNQVILPRRDGIFSDLATGQLYSFWNTVTNAAPDYDNDWQFTFDAIIEMDENLNFGAIHLLETPIYTEDYALILTGKGFVGLASYYPNGEINIINLNDFSVQNLGQVQTEHYGSENWADWGVLEYDGIDFYGVYRDEDYAIVRHNFTTDNISTLINFNNNSAISDLSSFTISPWNNRWYFHYEYNSTLFGGTSETLGYAAAGSNSSVLSSNGLGCYSEVTVSVNQIDLGEDIIACENQSPVVLFAGNGYQSYTWNGVNNDYNAFPVTESGAYIVVAVDNSNCSITDTINVLFESCLGLENGDNSGFNVSFYPNPTSNQAKVDFTTAVSSEMNLTITDVNGKIIFTDKRTTQVGFNSINLNVSTLTTGVYLLNLSSEEGMQIIRFVKN